MTATRPDISFRMLPAQFSQSQVISIVDKLVADGWTWKTSNVPDPASLFCKGWWVNANHPTQWRATGDPKSFYQAAEATFRCYMDAEL